jgi:NDP-sugar pyrophosphorylase family protein
VTAGVTQRCTFATLWAMKPTLLVLAAGMGSRYGGVKQIDPVGPSGEAIIDYSLYDAIRAGFGKVVFVVRRDIESDVRDFFAGKFDGQLEAEYVIQDLKDVPDGFAVPPERSKPWGTGHAVLAARDVMDTPFAVINGDDFYGRPALTAMAEYLQKQTNDETDYAMVGYRLDRTLSENGTVSRGIVTEDSGGWLVSIEEHTRIRPDGDGVVSLDDNDDVRAVFTGAEATSMNLFGFTPAVMGQFRREFSSFLQDFGGEAKREFYIPYAMNLLKEKGEARMKVLKSDSQWFGVTYREDRPDVVSRIQNLVADGVYPASLWE